MAETQTEREDKYEVATTFALPELAEFADHVERADLELLSVYYDTPAHDLLRSSVTLRRRSGDADTGWHAKLPAGVARTEVRSPLTDSDDVPDELAELTLGLRRGRPLGRVASLTTHRHVVRLLDSSGTLLAEIADDSVLATASGASMVASQWREVEVELGSGDEKLLASIGKRLVRAGARPAASPSKLARALAPLQPAKTGKSRTVGELAVDYLIEQRAALLDGDLGLRRAADVIHPTRVATRRSRSTLRTFGDVFDADRAETLDEELAWYASILGDVRDLDVLGKHLAQAAAELPIELVPDAVATDIANRIGAERASAMATLLAELNGERYLNLLRNLDDWIAEPPFTKRAAAPKADVRTWMARAERKVAKRLAGAGDDGQLHAARKSAKRARYAAELARPVLGSKLAKQKIKKYTDLQDTLGQHQDGVVAAQWLLANGAGVAAVGDLIPTIHRFAYGVLYARV